MVHPTLQAGFVESVAAGRFHEDVVCAFDWFRVFVNSCAKRAHADSAIVLFRVFRIVYEILVVVELTYFPPSFGDEEASASFPLQVEEHDLSSVEAHECE